MNGLINQGPPQVQSLYIKHPQVGHKVIESTELAQYLAAGWHVMNKPTWRYHLTAGADIFGEDELPGLEKQGWVDSPAKLVLRNEPISPVPDIEDAKMQEADKYARELLGGEGLSQASLMRCFGKDNKNTTQRNRFKPIYDAIFSIYVSQIKKQGVCWYWIDKNELDNGVPSEE